MEKLGVIFPGTASFYAGMGKELYINYPIAMETYREIESLTGCNLTDRLFDSYCCEGFTLKEKRLSLLAAEIIGFKLWQEKYRICLNVLLQRVWGLFRHWYVPEQSL